MDDATPAVDADTSADPAPVDDVTSDEFSEDTTDGDAPADSVTAGVVDQGSDDDTTEAAAEDGGEVTDAPAAPEAPEATESTEEGGKDDTTAEPEGEAITETEAPADSDLAEVDEVGEAGNVTEAETVTEAQQDTTAAEGDDATIDDATVAAAVAVETTQAAVTEGASEGNGTTEAETETETEETSDVVTATSVDTALAPVAGNATENTTEAEAQTTEATAEAVATTAEEAETTVAPTTQEPEVPCEPADSPCCLATILKQDERHITKTAPKDERINDKDLADGWYGFKYQDEWAEITEACIKPGHCSTLLGYHIVYSHGSPSTPGELVKADLKAAAEVAGKMECDTLSQKVEAMACQGGYTVYRIEGGLKRDDASICTQLINETVPYNLLAIPPVTEAPETTEPPTSEPRMPLNTIPRDEMTEGDYGGAVTVEIETEEELDNEFLAAFDEYFRAALAKKLSELAPNDTDAAEDAAAEEKEEEPTEQPAAEVITAKVLEDAGLDDMAREKAPEEEPVGPVMDNIDPDAKGMAPTQRRKRQAPQPATISEDSEESEDRYSADDVYYMEPTPRKSDDGKKVQAVIVVREKDGTPVPAERVKEALDAMKEDGTLAAGAPAPVSDYYMGLPGDLDPSTGASSGRPDIWESHMGLFIAVIVLVAICILVLLIGLCCIKCRGSGSWDPKADRAPIAMEEGTKKKSPPSNMVIENPLPDEEIVRDEAPMVERANPSVSPNGSGQHLRGPGGRDGGDDNGWVVPLDQLTDAERAEPDVANTKL